jgi:hypothetical protein
MDWQSTDEGKRSMAKKHERTLAEERDRMIDLIVDEQIELHQAEVKKQAKASRKSHQSRQLCRHCGKPRQSYKFEDKFERRESYPDEFYTDESCLDEPSSYY